MGLPGSFCLGQFCLLFRLISLIVVNLKHKENCCFSLWLHSCESLLNKVVMGKLQGDQKCAKIYSEVIFHLSDSLTWISDHYLPSQNTPLCVFHSIVFVAHLQEFGFRRITTLPQNNLTLTSMYFSNLQSRALCWGLRKEKNCISYLIYLFGFTPTLVLKQKPRAESNFVIYWKCMH